MARLVGAFENSYCGGSGQREGGTLLLLVLGRSRGTGTERRVLGVCSCIHSFPGSSDLLPSGRHTAMWVTGVCSQRWSDRSVLLLSLLFQMVIIVRIAPLIKFC